MRLPRSRRLALLACSFITLGCTDSLAPEDVAGLYVLERIGSEPLPAVMWENELNTVLVTSGTIRLRPDGSGTVSGTEESIPRQDGLPATNTSRLDVPIRFRTDGVRIEIEFLCPANANCSPPPHIVARPTLGGLRVTLFHAPILMHYARVASTE